MVAMAGRDVSSSTFFSSSGLFSVEIPNSPRRSSRSSSSFSWSFFLSCEFSYTLELLMN